ncbi:molybdenum cofactor guanylyltransferase [Pedobacter sp. MR22-3]|uniref:molybdenum cofactor guanylyltransferase n=1 Tax=Pedobacter sp. MR22-3 TaxID=2994552 RepID=UPI00224659D9|nr:molybdenum cofactor guanylyltransferase [Pedobacter sp. MR22-3]MCX2586501.1 molybdenum cofactor guanylyltransferase [Pedobacter sp. MR22-3]
MLGIVCCGGKSTRMGTDKGLISMGNGNWAIHAFQKLKGLGIPVAISVNESQRENYLPFFKEEQFIFDDPSLDIAGPVLALLSVHAKHPLADLLVLACDLPLMETSLLTQLLDAENKLPAKEAFVFGHDGNPEPLCAIYKAGSLAKVMHELKGGRLTRHSMKHVLSLLKVCELIIPEGKTGAFKNFNTYDGV